MCYFYLGNNLTGNFITDDLNQKSIPVILIIVAVSVNMIFTYAIEATPIHIIMDPYIL